MINNDELRLITPVDQAFLKHQKHIEAEKTFLASLNCLFDVSVNIQPANILPEYKALYDQQKQPARQG